jgi:hypothetical protein
MNNNPGNIKDLARFFELKTKPPKNETSRAAGIRTALIKSYLRPRVQNRIAIRSGSIQFTKTEDIYKFFKGMYFDILHDAKNNDKSKKGTTGDTKIQTIIKTVVGDFDHFIDRYFQMVYSMNGGKGGQVTKLKNDIEQLAIADEDFLHSTAIQLK